MINHIRTLLLNETAMPGELGEEFVPEAFVPQILPASIEKVRKLLLGSMRRAMNYRLTQLMQLVHTSELEEFVVAPDSRITYLPFDDCFFTMNPPEDLTVVASLLRKLLTAEDEQAIFGEHPVEPFKSFQALWLNHSQLHYSLGGLVLALAYRIDAQRGCDV